ncbi:hypothetical protein A4R35_04780 [Thermogemmatispora tikiterensis]|uniref:Uncharacterized protein n=1 Tax=Thermogemmatispora tikiterensis TaxID=1825093 RepID=A0A328VGG8_9CHLR|nr:hypothetical protein A4R35_04780 [Thermogemmatispora tikiterensis]
MPDRRAVADAGERLLTVQQRDIHLIDDNRAIEEQSKGKGFIGKEELRIRENYQKAVGGQG